MRRLNRFVSSIHWFDKRVGFICIISGITMVPLWAWVCWCPATFSTNQPNGTEVSFVLRKILGESYLISFFSSTKLSYLRANKVKWNPQSVYFRTTCYDNKSVSLETCRRISPAETYGKIILIADANRQKRLRRKPPSIFKTVRCILQIGGRTRLKTASFFFIIFFLFFSKYVKKKTDRHIKSFGTSTSVALNSSPSAHFSLIYWYKIYLQPNSLLLPQLHRGLFVHHKYHIAIEFIFLQGK